MEITWVKKFKKVFKKEKTAIEDLEVTSCENCEYEFKGHFCPNCGQAVAEFNRPVGFVFYDFIGNFFAFDTRFFKTFKYLLFYPGKLTKEFFKGRRVSYSPPFRIFVFLSFVLFLLLQIISDNELKQVIDSPLHLKTGNAIADSTVVAINDSLKTAIAEVDSSLASENINLNLSDLAKGNIRENLNALADHVEKKLDQTDDPEEQREILNFINLLRSPDQVATRALKYLSWAFFVLLPIFALLLKLVYIRRKKYYMSHFIFSVHLHSFLFFLMIIIIALNMIFKTGMGAITIILLLCFPVYFILALKNFYGQKMTKVFLKFLTVSLFYNIILLTAVTIVLINALDIV